MAKPAVTTPPGELIYSETSFSGFSDSRTTAVPRNIRHVVVHRPDDEDHALFQKARINVIGTLAASRLFDDHGNEIQRPLIHVFVSLFCSMF